jgi:hypothetical protein
MRETALSTHHPSLRRAVGLASALLLVLAGALAAVAAPAQAAAPPWGFAHVNTSVLGPLPDLQRQATGANTIAELTVAAGGHYEVKFPGVGAPRGVVHVMAINTRGHWCQVRGWAQSGADERVRIDCYRPGGVLAPTDFSVLWTAVKDPLATGGHAYLYSDPGGALLESFNSTGGANVVAPSAPVGQWDVQLNGFGAAARAGNLQVTAVDAQQGARCKVSRWGASPAAQVARINCRDSFGNPLKTSWTLSYTVKRSIIGLYPPRLFAYCLDLGNCDPSDTSFNNAGCANSVIGAGSGLRLFQFGCVGMYPSHVMVTSYGSGPQYCGMIVPWVASGGTAILRDVVCFDPGGGPSTTTSSLVAYTGIR